MRLPGKKSVHRTGVKTVIVIYGPSFSSGVLTGRVPVVKRSCEFRSSWSYGQILRVATFGTWACLNFLHFRVGAHKFLRIHKIIMDQRHRDGNYLRLWPSHGWARHTQTFTPGESFLLYFNIPTIFRVEGRTRRTTHVPRQWRQKV